MQLAVLGPPHLIDCFVEVFGNMKLVMHDFGLGRCLSGDAQVRLPHVDSDRFDLVTLLDPEPCPEFLAGLSCAVRDNVQNPALFQIGHEADIILPAAKALLVNTNQSYRLHGATLQASFDGSLHDLMRTVPIQPQEPCLTADCLASLQHPNGKGFKHQRKAAVLAGQGTSMVLTPCSGQLTRGVGATKTVSNYKVSRCAIVVQGRGRKGQSTF